jgi:biopolymer transport protein ExbB
MFVKVFEQWKLFRQAATVQKAFWGANSIPEGIEALRGGTPFRFIAESGMSATEHHEGKLLEQIDLNTWVTMSIQRAVDNVTSRLQDGLAFLATVGSTAPFVGLFGTVWASTTRSPRSASPARPRSTRSRAPWARRSS